MKHIIADTYLYITAGEQIKFMTINDLRSIFDKDYKYRAHDDETFDLWLCEHADTNALRLPEYFPVSATYAANGMYHGDTQHTVYKLGKLLHLMYENFEDMDTDDDAYASKWRIHFVSHTRKCTADASIIWGAEEWDIMERMVTELICAATH